MKESKTPIHLMTRNMLDLTAQATKMNLVIPIWVSADLWQQLAGVRTLELEDARPYALLAQLKNAIRENYNGHNYFGCLEQGIHFDVEINMQSATVVATMDYENGRALLRLRTADECLNELCQTPAPAVPIARNIR